MHNTMNSGNIVSRVGRLRRHRALAWCVAVVAIGVAIAGWVRPTKVIAERPVFNNTDCSDWCSNQETSK